MLDITRLEKGSKFACANCGTILVVGEAVKVKRSLKEGGPAFKPRTQKEEAPRVQRTRRRRPAEGGAEPAPRKSKLPLFLGIGAVVVAGVVAIALMGGEGGGGSREASPVEWWASKEGQLLTADAATLRAWLAEGKAKGFDKDSAFWGPKEDRIYAALAKQEPDNVEANRRLGRKALQDYPDFTKVWEGMNSDFRLLPDDLKDFVDACSQRIEPGKKLWLGEDEYAKAKTKLDAYVAFRKEMDANPAAESIDRARSQATTILDTRERHVDFVARAEGSFILLLPYAKGEGEESLKKDREEQATRYAAALKVLAAEFETRYREPMGLDPIEPGRYYVHVIVDRLEDLRRFVQGEGYDPGGDIPAFFSIRTHWSHVLVPGPLVEGGDAGLRDKELANVGGDIAHEAVHQLQWNYSADAKFKQLNHMDEWGGIWLTEGWAEYLGGGVRLDPKTGKAEWTGRPPRRLEYLRAMKDNGVPAIPLRDLVQLNSLEAFSRYIDGWIGLIHSNEDLPESVGTWLGQERQTGLDAKLMYAQSWLLIAFLNEYEDGKYKDKFFDLLRTALRGKRKPEKYRKDPTIDERWASSAEAFEAIMGLSSEDDWKALQKEFDRFRKAQLREE